MSQCQLTNKVLSDQNAVLKQRIAELEQQIDTQLQDVGNLQAAQELQQEQIEQLREALMYCKGFVDAYGQPETKEIVSKALEETK